MFYEISLVLFGVYIEQTYHLPLFSVIIDKFKKNNYTETNFIYNFIDYLKKKK